MSVFPRTPTSLLTRIAADMSGENETVWTEFFELYEPAMRDFLLRHGAEANDVGDLVMQVFEKLVAVLRNGTYDRGRGRFRSYLATLLYNEMISEWRKREVCRASQDRAMLVETEKAAAAEASPEIETKDAARWIEARRSAAVAHVLARMPIAELHKRVFLRLERTEENSSEVAARFGLTPAAVRQIKSRIGKMVAAVEERMGM